MVTDTEAHLDMHEHTTPLRFITCGSAGAGTSTLVARLVHETQLAPEAHTPRHEADSSRSFSTERRTFIVAEAPERGHVTRHMITGASTADLAVILIDAGTGVVDQTLRHSYLVSLLGIDRILLAINKLDLVDHSEDVFEQIKADYRAYADKIGLPEVTAIPVVAITGDNISERSEHTPWYHGPTLIEHLETVEIGDTAQNRPFRLPVQRVDRTSSDLRAVSGTIVGGSVRPGDRIAVLPAGARTRVARVSTSDRELEQGVAGQAVTIVLADDVDVSRGSVLCAADEPAQIADQFEAHIIWLHERAMQPGRQYFIQLGGTTAGLTISAPKYKLDVNTLEHLAAKTLAIDEIGVCTVSSDRPIVFDPYTANRDMGGFIVVDRVTNATIGAGLLHFALRRSTNVHWQAVDVTPAARTALMGHRPAVIWLTGLSGAGKSTIANEVEQRLHAVGAHTILLDGDNVRHGLNRDLGFTEADRIENIRRVSEVARLMVDAGLIVVVSFISPFRAERDLARQLVGPERFVEVFVDVTIDVAELRDPKGLYAKARNGELPNFTGISSPYEAPISPDIHIDTVAVSAIEASKTIVEHLRVIGVIGR